MRAKFPKAITMYLEPGSLATTLDETAIPDGFFQASSNAITTRGIFEADQRYRFWQTAPGSGSLQGAGIFVNASCERLFVMRNLLWYGVALAESLDAQGTDWTAAATGSGTVTAGSWHSWQYRDYLLWAGGALGATDQSVFVMNAACSSPPTYIPLPKTANFASNQITAAVTSTATNESFAGSTIAIISRTDVNDAAAVSGTGIAVTFENNGLNPYSISFSAEFATAQDWSLNDYFSFTAVCDDGARVWLADQPQLDTWAVYVQKDGSAVWEAVTEKDNYIDVLGQQAAGVDVNIRFWCSIIGLSAATRAAIKKVRFDLTVQKD